MRIIICSSFFPPHHLGGAELVAYKQALTLQALGHEVRVFCGRLASYFLRSRRAKVERGILQVTRVRLSPQDISGTSWDFRNPEIEREFCRLLDAFTPDLVHFHNLVGLSLGLIDTCHDRRIPTVMTLHDYWGICFKNTLLKNNGRLCHQGGLDCLDCRELLAGTRPLPTPVRNAHVLLSLRKVSRFISPSHYLADQYAANGFPRGKISVLKNGIDVDSFKPPRPTHTPLTLGFIGHLGQHKGLDVLLHALSFLDARQIRLLVVGEGEEAGPLKTLCQQRGMQRYVTFAGHIDNRRIASVYQQIDVLVVPSVWAENSPVTITEAMASGIPVIASDVGGIGELVDDGMTGFLVPVQDSQAMAERIRRFVERPTLKQEMGQKGLEKIQQYRLQDQVAQLVGLYQQTLSSHEAIPPLPFALVLYDAAEPWSLALHDMFQRLTEVEEKLLQRLSICRADLSGDDIWSAAKLFVVATPSPQSSSYALQALQHAVPILVPEHVDDLKSLCLLSNSGLFYGNPEELKECLLRLLGDDSLRRALATNGPEFLGRIEARPSTASDM